MPVRFDEVCVDMAQIVCDTNFLMKITRESLPSFSEFISENHFEITTISAVVRELDGLRMNKRISVARESRNCLSLIGKKIRLRDHAICNEPDKDADIELFELAKNLDEDSFVATLDGKLLSRFERNGLPYLTLRNDKPFVRSFHRATYLSTEKE